MNCGLVSIYAGIYYIEPVLMAQASHKIERLSGAVKIQHH